MKIILLGASGRLGKEILSVLHERKVSVIEAQRIDITSQDFWQKAANGGATIIDVTLPEGTMSALETIVHLPSKQLKQLRYVCGVTGLTAAQLKLMKKFSGHIPICHTPNFSAGIYALKQILGAKTPSGKPVGALLRELGFDLGIVELHHNLKKDAPSGTAKLIAESLNVPMEQVASLRVGSVVGEHEVIASSDSEEIRIKHVANSRRLFALGAVRVAEAMSKTGMQPAWYEMSDLL